MVTANARAPHPQFRQSVVRYSFMKYRIRSNKRRGAYFVLRREGVALIRVRRLFEHSFLHVFLHLRRSVERKLYPLFYLHCSNKITLLGYVQ